jgi:hypothetical protein
MMDGKVANVVSPSSKSLDFNIFIASVDPSFNKFRPQWQDEEKAVGTITWLGNQAKVSAMHSARASLTQTL